MDLRHLLEKRIHECEKRKEAIEAQLASYQAALDQEMLRNGNYQAPVAAAGTSKTQALLAFIGNQRQGVTHLELREHLKSLNLEVSKNFTYNFVDRAKKAHQIVERSGRIFRK